jgi:tRNA U55 pseudouridine synthase TruB
MRVRSSSMRLLGLSVQWPEATLEVSCSKGTYIRVLAEDLGAALGCGAHLVGLRRSEVGHLSLAQSISLDDLLRTTADHADFVLPVDALLQTLPHLTVDAATSQAPRNGSARSTRGKYQISIGRSLGADLSRYRSTPQFYWYRRLPFRRTTS